MASRGYYFTLEDGTWFAVPAPGVMLCPMRCEEMGWNGYPQWLVEFTPGDLWYFRRFGEYPDYSLEKLEDGTFVFRDVSINTVMYTMTPTYNEYDVFSGYDVTWEETVTEDVPSMCDAEGDCILPLNEGGDVWGEFRIDLDHLVFPVYNLEKDMMEITEGAGEEEIVKYSLKYLADLAFEARSDVRCNIWEYETQESVCEFTIGSGEVDSSHRRVYALAGADCSVLFGDDGFVLYDGAGDRVGSGTRFEHDDDAGFNDGWGMDALSSVALEDYLAAFPSDQRRMRSDGLRKEVWDASVGAQANPLDKIMLMTRMWADAALEWETETWPIEIPPNFARTVDDGVAVLKSTKTGWDVLDEEGEALYSVTRAGDGDGTTWNFYSPSAGTKYVVRPVGDGTFAVNSNDGTLLYEVAPKESLEDFELNGEYSQENLYPALNVVEDELLSYEISKPAKEDDPFELTGFAEFVDQIPLHKVKAGGGDDGGEDAEDGGDDVWMTYAGDPRWYPVESTNLKYWIDIYDRWNEMRYRVAKPNEWDGDDREVYDIDGNLVATWTSDSLVSAATGNLVAKMYPDPEVLHEYQLFDNTTADYLYLTHYANGLIVILNRKGNVSRYVTPSGELRGPTWYLFGTVESGKVLGTDGETLYTFVQNSGDWNMYDADGNLVGHLYSSSEANNEWVIAEGCQRLFTFLAPRTYAVISSDGSYVFTGKDGSKTSSRIQIQAEQSGQLVLTVLDEEGEEMYRVSNTGSAYQIKYKNGVEFDTARAYETYSQDNMVLTRYWSVPYDRMMYSCTNDQPEGSFDGTAGGNSDDAGAGPASYSVNVGSGAVRSVSDSGVRVLAAADQPRTIADSSTSDGNSESGGSSLGTADNIQDMIDSMSDFFDGINGVLAKDTNTSKGEDLDPEEPLAISQAETDGRLIANAAFTAPSTLTSAELHALSDAYDYTQAITRISKIYSQGRADMYKEAQDYAATRTKRIEAKKAAFTSVMSKAKERVQREQGG